MSKANTASALALKAGEQERVVSFSLLSKYYFNLFIMYIVNYSV